MKQLFFAFLLLACSASPCRAGGLQLSIRDGKVSIDAQDVTIRQILAEWSRVGQTRIVNVERLSGGPITIKFDGVPERQALNIVLRNVPGYIAAPRATFVADASMYDTILIMATTTAVAAVRAPSPPGYAGLPGPAGNVTQLRQGAPLTSGAPPGYAGLPSPAGNGTQLRQVVPLTPGVLPELFLDPASDQQDDPAIAAAAAAGLVMVPAPMPGPSGVSAPLLMPGGVAQPQPSPAAPVATPSNPWNAPIGTPQPSLAPPPAPTLPILRPRVPQADQ